MVGFAREVLQHVLQFQVTNLLEGQNSATTEILMIWTAVLQRCS